MYGCTINEKGSFDFFRRLWVVGTLASVERMYGAGQFACGEGVAARLAGRAIGGGGASISNAWTGAAGP